MNDNELYHYGILGMRWGVRRSKAQLGRAKKSKKGSEDDNAHEDYKRAHSSKSVKNMSDKELRDVNNRLQMESQYSKLTAKKTSAGKKFLTGVLVTAGTTVATTYATTYMKKGVEYAGKKLTANNIKKAAATAAAVHQIRKFKP